MSGFAFDGRGIGDDHQPLLIAELGTNFRGDLDLAKRFVEVAAESGADAVKFQTHIAAAEMAESAMRELDFGDLYDRIATYKLSLEDHEELKAHCHRHDLSFLSTPFSVAGVERLADLGVPGIKIGSGELTNYPLLRAAANTGAPLLVSTGMADFETIARSVEFLSRHTDEFALLYCISEYPTDPSQFDFGAIQRMKSTFDVPVGFSNHAPGTATPTIAMAQGANLVEAHFTIDRRLPGGDPEVSLEPDQFKRLAENATLVHRTQGDTVEPTQAERDTAEWAHHSVVTASHVEAGSTFTSENLTTKRPGTGIPANRFQKVLGMTAATSIRPDTVLKTDHVQEE
jgi:N-acetylneuraminate synthase/N,N'-diacetyllegionaminate synthase